MKKPRHRQLLDKSLSACVSAIEVYNKPDFRFREEAFSVLMCTAWELLLKAKVLKDNGNDVSSIVEKDYRRKKDGTKTKRKYPKLNRCGNPMTLGLFGAMELIRSKGNGIDQKCYESIILLTEIRDNAVHFINKTSSFSTSVQEVGTANIRNYMTLASEWFRTDFSRYNFYLMPLSFFGPETMIESVIHSRRGSIQLQNLERHIKSVAQLYPSADQDRYSVTLALNIKFVRSAEAANIRVRSSNDPSAVPVSLREDDFMVRYPLDYQQVVQKLRVKLPGLRVDQHFHRIKRELEKEPKYCMIRLLDPKNPRSSKKKFYTSEMLAELERRLAT